MAKNTKFLAWILSGVLFVGSLSPITSNAAELPVESQTTDETEETMTEIPSAGYEEDGIDPGDGTTENSVENTEDESEEKESIMEEETDEEVQEEASEEECVVEIDAEEIENDSTGEEVKVLESDRHILTNALSEYNTNFEGAGEGGAIYWWNGPSWNQNGISRKAYESGSVPASDCGEYYLEVSPFSSEDKSQSAAQICNEAIATLIKPEITYEFTYWAKLSGEERGEVSLQITSVNEDWTSQQSAAIKLDSEITLDADQWKQISGTFRIPAHSVHKQVSIKFTGSEKLSFCIDDLRVAALEDEKVDYGDNLVKNPYFAEADLSIWEKEKGSASITAGNAGAAVFDDVTTYGVIENRGSNYDCFAQDMTDVIRSGNSYHYSFYVMLDAEDYKDAPEAQREVCFAPYVKLEDGSAEYWGSYSTGILDSGCSRRIPAGEWIRFEGSFNPKFKGTAQSLVIRIVEQGTDNGGGTGVMGKYYVTGVSICEEVKPVKEIEKDIPNLKDSVSGENGIGKDAYTGTVVGSGVMQDETLMQLVEKHFNAVTLENELKMDALFGYSATVPELETVNWTRADGTAVTGYQVPKFDYSRAEECLDMIKKWNDENPEQTIKVRGHVLVWHSQAPEWFFHEDWDADKPYVTIEEMDKRQEWYIKTVLEHFTGESSPYRGMFYGWDVVNEAVSDNRGTYRDDTEKSSWWAVYKSEDYIINAFRYANKYAPADIELYYNDYNECNGNKVDGIEQLLKDVKAHENDAVLPTRISAMGMQSHHEVSSPTISQIREAAIRYGKVVGKIQLTELDIKASNDFDGTDATLQSEYTKQAYRYKDIYDTMREIDAMPDIDVNGITIWGVIDKYSWLQESNSAGGGSDGSKRQVPLLFDDDYKAKPAFYAFVNAEKLEPFIRDIKVIQAVGDNPYASGKTYTIEGIDASFIPVWTESGLKIQVTVSDASANEDDGVAVYIDWDKSRAEGITIEPIKRARTECQALEGNGYIAEFEIPKELSPAKGFCMDIVVTDNGQSYAFNDRTMKQGTSSKYYASAVTKPYMVITKAANGGIVIDGEADAAWEQAQEVELGIRAGAEASAVAKVLWDEQYLYVLADVADSNLDKSSEAVHEQDSLEVFIDENNHKTDSYEEDDKQYRVNFENEKSFNGPKCNADNMESAAVKTDKGYRVEAAYKWTDITPASGLEIGIEIQINDAKGGKRIGTASWYDESGQGWSSPGVFGTAVLGGLAEKPEIPETPVTKEKLSSLISECEAMLQDKDKYTGESWEVFVGALKKAKEAAESPNTEQKAIEDAYKELMAAKTALKAADAETTEKSELKKLIGECEKLNQNDYTKESWADYTKALAEAKAAADNEAATQEDIQKAFANLSKAKEQLKDREGLWAFEIGDVTYTGKALKPEVTVYNGRTLLTKGKDYTVSYKNNTKTSTNGNNAKVIIKGKGNYAGSITKEFKIVPKNLTDEDVMIPDLYVMPPRAGKSITPAPIITRNGKKLNKKEYSVSAKDQGGNPVDNITAPGIYTVEVTGVEAKGYTGTRAISLTVLNSDQRLMSAVKVTGIKNKEYTGGDVCPEFTAKYGRDQLVLNEDYTITCDSVEIGTATAVLKGTGKTYVGEKTVTFKITGTVLKAKDVKLDAADIVYTGSAIEPAVTIEGAKKDVDYTVTYDKNTQAGTATVIVKGIGKYTGTVKKNFKIAAFDLKENKEGKLSYQSNITARYMKGGSKLKEADLNAAFCGKPLVEGVDYTLVYTKNRQTGSEATVKIKGKGNFKGITAPINFTIEQQDIGVLTDISAPDVLQKNAKNYDRVNPVVKDLDGKSLKKGTDFKIVSYTKEDGKTPIEGTPTVGDKICVTIEGINNYKGTAYAYFRIIENNRNISKAKVTVKPQSYTGKAVTLSEKNTNTGETQIVVTMKVNGVQVTLKENEDYIILENGYSKNINKGTAKMTIQGIGDYGGTKKASFKIIAYDFKDNVEWYESLYNKTKSWFNGMINR